MNASDPLIRDLCLAGCVLIGVPLLALFSGVLAGADEDCPLADPSGSDLDQFERRDSPDAPAVPVAPPLAAGAAPFSGEVK